MEYKLRYSPETIDNMRYHVILKRIDQYIKYKKEIADALKKATKNLTNK